MLERYFRGLYQRTMSEAYSLAHREIITGLGTTGRCLDCGAGEGKKFDYLQTGAGLSGARYTGVEWSRELADAAVSRNINVVHGDLNRPLPFPDGGFEVVFGLSVLEHLLFPCSFLKEAYRVTRPGGRLVLLTPNISTYFTAALVLLGKMPSSGPHPDSEILLRREQLFRVAPESRTADVENAVPVHRHLVVFSYRVLKSYLRIIGFRQVSGAGFGLYPFPNWAQPLLEKLDPWHCHQMVFTAVK